ncbi:MAG: hypothetical protein ACK4LQ_01195 [Pararhodobacter sp.]
MLVSAIDREAALPIRASAADLHALRTVLVVEAPGALSLLQPAPGRQSVVITQYGMLRTAMLAQIRPDAVIGPLIRGGWDILDLGEALEACGYAGPLFILSRPLPRAELVLRELGAVCPRLSIRLIEII